MKGVFQQPARDSEGNATGRLIGCQVKSGPSYFREQTSAGIVYRGDSQHLAYWLGHSLPVIVILHDQETDCCHWQAVTEHTIERTGSGWKIEVPFSQVLNESIRVYLERLADTGWIESVRTFITRDRFFKRFEANPLFDFSQTLRGREAHLKRLTAFLSDSEATIAVVTGRGGIGKSKLLHDWTAQSIGWTVLFKKERASVHANSEIELRTHNILVIADDAHRQSDIDALLQLIRDKRREGANIKCVLSARPVGMARIDAALSRSFDPKSVIRLKELQQLGPSEVKALAAEILGSSHSRLVPFLMAASSDTPLVTVIGGRLLVSGAVDGVGLVTHEEFRRSVFDKILDDLEAVANLTARNPRALLHLIAALQPIVLRSEQSLTDLASFLGWKEFEIAQSVDRLESSGLLIRSGNLYRLAPDLFADFLLEQATINAVGEPTRFADDVYREFRGGYLSNLLQNLAELDFRVLSKGGQSILDKIWEDIHQSFEAGSSSDRIFLLEKIENSAFFQPAQVMKLVRTAMATEGGLDGNESVKWVIADKNVFELLPEILRATACQPAFRTESLERLWTLAKREGEPSYSRHPSAANVLKALASYSRYKPVEINHDVARLVSVVINTATAFCGKFTPLDIVDELMQREGEENESVGMTLTLYSFGLNYEVVKPVREICFSVIEKCLSSPQASIACSAFRSIVPLISGYLTKYGRQQSEDELMWQAAERSRCLLLLKDRLLKGNAPLGLMREIKAKLEWLYTHSSSDGAATEIKAVLVALPSSPVLELFDAFCTGEWDIRTASSSVEDIEIATESNRKRCREAAELMKQLYPNVSDRIVTLRAFVNEAEQGALKTDGANDFMHHLCRDSVLLRELGEQIFFEHLPCELIPVIPVILWSLKDYSPSEYLRIGRVAARSAADNVVLGGAGGIYGALFKPALPEDLALVDELIKRDCERARSVVIRVLFRVGKYCAFRKEAVDRLLVTRVTNDKTADDICEALIYGHDIPLGSLNDEEFRRLLRLFLQLPELSRYSIGHHIGMVLQRGAEDHPDAIIQFLSERIEEAERRHSNRDWSYKIIPGSGKNFTLKKVGEAGGSAMLLSAIADRIGSGSLIADDLAVLFWDITVPGGESFNFFRPFLKRNAKSCAAAIRAISRGPRQIAVKYPDFTVECLESAEQFGDAALDRALAQFTSNAFPIGSTWSDDLSPAIEALQGNATERKGLSAVHRLLEVLYIRIVKSAEAEREVPTFDFNLEDTGF